MKDHATRQEKLDQISAYESIEGISGADGSSTQTTYSFLGGIPKAKVLQVLKPHIFFDDKIDNLEESADTVPCVYIPASE